MIFALYFDGNFAEFELFIVFEIPLYVATFEAMSVFVEYVSLFDPLTLGDDVVELMREKVDCGLNIRS